MIVNLIPILHAISGMVYLLEQINTALGTWYSDIDPENAFFSLLLCITRHKLLLPKRTNRIFPQSCLRSTQSVLPSVIIWSTKALDILTFHATL